MQVSGACAEVVHCHVMVRGGCWPRTRKGSVTAAAARLAHAVMRRYGWGKTKGYQNPDRKAFCGWVLDR